MKRLPSEQEALKHPLLNEGVRRWGPGHLRDHPSADSLRTEQSYVGWIKRFIWFHGKRRRMNASADFTTMIYTHVLNKGGRGVVSPIDRMGLT